MLTQHVQDLPEARIVHLAGELNNSTSITLSRILDEALQLNAPSIVLEFSEVTVLTSTAQKVVLNAHLKSANHQDKSKIMLCNLNKHLGWLVEMTGLSKLVSVYSSLDLALLATKPT